MNELEKKLGLEMFEYTPEDIVLERPSAYNLKNVPKFRQTSEMVEIVCKNDGLALQYVSKKLITSNLCEIAVRQNGVALKYVPEKIVDEKGYDWLEKICRIAVLNNGEALEYVPGVMKSKEIVEIAIQSPVSFNVEVDSWHKYPIFYAPRSKKTEDMIIKSINFYPLSINSIPKKAITEEIAKKAVEGNGLALEFVPKEILNSELVNLALSNNVMTIRLVPNEFLNQELIDMCFKRNNMILPYIPEEFITEKMCMNIIDQHKCFFSAPSKETRITLFGDSDVDIILFEDFPENIRNNIKILDALVHQQKNGAALLIEWNERIIDSHNNVNSERYIIKNKRGNIINPLKIEIVEYLEKRVIKPEGDETDKVIKKLIESDLDVYIKQSKFKNQNILQSYNIETYKQNHEICHELSENDSILSVFYISDIHLEHQLINIIKKIDNKTEEEKVHCIKEFITFKISEMLESAKNTENKILLICGDVADSTYLSYLFYNELFKQWDGKKIISVMGNHELWDGTTFKEWNDPDYKSRKIETIIEDYKKIVDKKYKSYLLENELFVMYKGGEDIIIKEEDILNSSLEDLKELLSKCRLNILGGIAYSGLNPNYNADCGLYRKAVPSIKEDKYRTEKFLRIYKKVSQCAKNIRIIVLTHTPISDWLNEPYNKKWIYVNGHTHKNTSSSDFGEAVILSDNQIGYKPQKWKLNSFSVDFSWYDPFGDYEDGIYTITSEQYKEFNFYRNIYCKGCNYEGVLYMLKRNNIYMFLLKSKKNLCLMAGGSRKLLDIKDVNYYYNNMEAYSKKVNFLIEPYKNVMKKLSNEVKLIGGRGTIHGCIIDISFFSHIYVNPYDGKITFYWAANIMSRLIYDNIQMLLESKEPDLLKRFLLEYEKKSIPILEKTIMSNESMENAIIPEWMFGTEIYEPSRILKKIQYVWEKNIIRIWNDNVLINDLPQINQENKDG